MTEVKGLDTSVPIKKESTYVWVSCRGERCLIPFRSLCRIQLAKQLYDLSEGKEEPYLDLPLFDFHKILTLLRDDIRPISKDTIKATFSQPEFASHFNYLCIDADEISELEGKAKEDLAKFKDDVKNGRILRSEICPLLKGCKNKICPKAHGWKEFQPEKCDKVHSRCHICSCAFCVFGPSFYAGCQGRKDVAPRVFPTHCTCGCVCPNKLHEGESIQIIFNRLCITKGFCKPDFDKILNKVSRGCPLGQL